MKAGISIILKKQLQKCENLMNKLMKVLLNWLHKNYNQQGHTVNTITIYIPNEDATAATTQTDVYY